MQLDLLVCPLLSMLLPAYGHPHLLFIAICHGHETDLPADGSLPGQENSSYEPSASQPAVIFSQAACQAACQTASQAASQGVFSTMMAASKQKAKSAVPTALPAASDPATADIRCYREQEAALLAQIFLCCAEPESTQQILSESRCHRTQDGGDEVQTVSLIQSMWVCARSSDPPACQLQERVKKRKAAATALQAEVAKQRRLDQQAPQSVCNSADLALKASGTDAIPQKANAQESMAVQTSSEQADCIDLIAPNGMHKDQSGNARCIQEVSQSEVQLISERTMDPMKRMRLQALQQELKAAKQTVADLERMIKIEQLT